MLSLKEVVAKMPKQRVGPLWQGPEAEGPLGGITFSMLSKWLECRERFWVRYIEGWRGTDQFRKAIEFGQMWHVCEEALAAEPLRDSKEWSNGTHKGWLACLKVYCQGLMEKYPLQREEVEHWYLTCRTQFPCYVDYWSKHKDVEQRTPLMQEQVFDVPYQLPSGRTVRLRGKFDSVDLIGKGKSAGVWLQENKTKGDVDRQALEEQLHFDLQTMMYLIALETYRDIGNENDADPNPIHNSNAPTLGVRYNVVRRPFSGGKGSIKRREATKNHPAETKDQFYQRLQNDYFRAEPEYWFQRWKSEVSPEDVKRFRKECLDPLLDNVCDWYKQITGIGGPVSGDYQGSFHWRHPFGVKNSVDEGYKSDVDGYIQTGSTVGLTKVDTLFTELQ